MKNCPFCSEQIQDAAVKCRYCQNWLVPPPPAFAQLPVNTQFALPSRKTSGMAIASLVLGVLWIYWIGSILALIFGYLAKKEIRDSPQQMEGNGLATAGIVLGWVGMGTLALVILFVIIAALADKQEHTPTPKTTSQTISFVSPRREHVREPQLARHFLRDFHLPS